MLLRVYNSERYLATAKHNSSITQIEDVNIGNAELDINVEDVASPIVINNVKVIAVKMLNTSDGRIQCGHTVIPTSVVRYWILAVGIFRCDNCCQCSVSVSTSVLLHCNNIVI